MEPTIPLGRELRKIRKDNLSVRTLNASVVFIYLFVLFTAYHTMMYALSFRGCLLFFFVLVQEVVTCYNTLV